MNYVPPLDPASIGAYLELVASRRTVVTYNEVVTKFGLPPLDGAWAAHPLSQLFELLDQQDAIANRPFRTSVVVSKKENAPGPGYYEALCRLKGIADPKNNESRLTIWTQELKDAYKYPW